MKPATEAELAEAIQQAEGSLCLCGGGTRRIGGGGGTRLDLSGLTGVSLYEPGALTIVAGAGMPLEALEQVLAREGQRLAFEAPDWRGLLGRSGVSTIGGVVAANASGPRRVQAGACRDSLIGLRFVDGAGRIIRNGGRVMKNVTGYDLVKLLAGSRGMLGAVTEVAFKVLPAPETEATLVLDVTGEARAVAVMAAALRSPFEVTGAAFSRGTVLLRIEGFAASVAYRGKRLATALQGFAAAEIREGDASAEVWRHIRDVAEFASRPFVARLALRPSLAPQVIAEIAAAFEIEVMLDWGGGLAWIAAEEGDARLLAALRGAVARHGGHATLFKGPEALLRDSAFQPEPPAIARLTKGLRTQFDPRGILTNEEAG